MKKIIVIALVFVAFGMISNAQAYSLLAIGDAQYVGSITDGIPSNEADEASYINLLTTLGAGATAVKLPELDPVPISDTRETYSRVGSSLGGPFPIATASGSVKIEPASKDDPPIYSFDSTGFQYILGKYDAAQAGSLVWYSASGFQGVIELPHTWGVFGLSHITAFNPTASVPEPSLFLLFGTALVGFVGVARRRTAKK